MALNINMSSVLSAATPPQRPAAMDPVRPAQSLAQQTPPASNPINPGNAVPQPGVTVQISSAARDMAARDSTSPEVAAAAATLAAQPPATTTPPATAPSSSSAPSSVSASTAAAGASASPAAASARPVAMQEPVQAAAQGQRAGRAEESIENAGTARALRMFMQNSGNNGTVGAGTGVTSAVASSNAPLRASA